jgi:hypothetical protein
MKLSPTLLTLAAVTTSLTLSAQAAEPQTTGTVDVKTGQTALAIDNTFLAALDASDVAFTKVTPGKVVLPKGELRFPIVGGTIDLAKLTSEVVHSGGVNFAKESTSVTVMDLILVLPTTGAVTTPVLTGVVVVNGESLGRVELFDVVTTLTAPISVPGNKKIVIKDADVNLTQDGADALNAAFSPVVPVFTTDTVVGKVSVSATVVKGSL